MPNLINQTIRDRKIAFADGVIRAIHGGMHTVQRDTASRPNKLALPRETYYELLGGQSSYPHLIFRNGKPYQEMRPYIFGLEPTFAEKPAVIYDRSLDPREDLTFLKRRNPDYTVEIEIKNPQHYRIQTNLLIKVRTRAPEVQTFPKNEWIAIETLREMITEQEYRRYIKYGFILVQGASGKIYQIFREDRHIKVWVKGEVVEELCVYIKDTKIPKTDKLIAFKTMIEVNEQEIRNYSNVYQMRKAA